VVLDTVPGGLRENLVVCSKGRENLRTCRNFERQRGYLQRHGGGNWGDASSPGRPLGAQALRPVLAVAKLVSLAGMRRVADWRLAPQSELGQEAMGEVQRLRKPAAPRGCRGFRKRQFRATFLHFRPRRAIKDHIAAREVTLPRNSQTSETSHGENLTVTPT
jgi:hypothetical protein